MVVDDQTMHLAGMELQTAGSSQKAVLRSFKKRVPTVPDIPSDKSLNREESSTPTPGSWKSSSPCTPFASFKFRREPSSRERPLPPHRSCLQWFFGCGPESQDKPESKLIHPLSPFGMFWIGITAVFLAYTAIVTPVNSVK